MGVTVIEPGRLVRVDPDEVSADDVLDFGAALIEEQGHIVRDSGDATRGWSIHGALGEAARRVTGESGKDGPMARQLRDAAALQLRDHHFPDIDPATGVQKTPTVAEHELNDTATGPAEAAERMRAARKGVQV